MTLKESTAQDTALAAKLPRKFLIRRRKRRQEAALESVSGAGRHGPGIVTAMAGNDAGGISTYSTVGAKFGT